MLATVLAMAVLAMTNPPSTEPSPPPEDLAAVHAGCIGDSIFLQWELFKDPMVAPVNRDFWSELGSEDESPTQFLRSVFLADTFNPDEATVSISSQSSVSGPVGGAWQLDEDNEGFVTPVGLLHGLLYECLADGLAMPERVRSHVEQTSALDGLQEDEWGIYSARWSYHPDTGLDFTAWITDPGSPLDIVPPETYDTPVIAPTITTLNQPIGDETVVSDHESEQAISGSVILNRVENGDEVEEWVPGVRIIVETKDGEIVAEDVTDETGHYVIGIDRIQTYVVRIDTNTLPEGLTIAEGEPAAYEVPVRNDSTTTRVFVLEETQAETTAG